MNRSLAWPASTVVALAVYVGQAQAQTFSVGANFTTTMYDSDTSEPPDTMGAAGPNHFVALNNERFAMFTKSGTPIMQGTDRDFWTSALGSDPGNITDPRILYDPLSQRWFAVVLTTTDITNRKILFARSNSSDPTQGFKGVVLATGQRADFPTLGLDANGVYVGTNNFNSAGTSLLSVGMYSVPKADLLADTPSLANMTAFSSESPSTRGFTLQAAVNYGPESPANPTPIVATDSDFFSVYDFTPLSGTTGPGATLGTTTYRTVQSTSLPTNSPQPGTTITLDNGDDRFSGNVVQVGSYLYAVHSVTVSGRTAVRWTIANATTFAIVQQGTISNSSLWYFYPSIAANTSGDVVIGFSGSNSTTYPSTYAVVGTSAGGTPGGSLTFGTPVQTKAGMDYYDGDRWGDYSATTVDPADPGIFWTHQEYAATRTLPGTNWNWATQATEIIPSKSGERCWSNTAGGDFGTSGNYFTATAPVATDHVIFSRPNTSYTVNFSGNNSSNRASVRQGNVTWNLSGGSYTLSNTNTATPSLAVAQFQGTASLTVYNGTLATKNAMIGGGTGGHGTLILGSDAVWNNGGTNPVIYGGTVDNSGTVNYSQASSGDAWHLNNGTINNLQGGIFNVGGIFWSYISPSGGTNLFNNAGTLIKKDGATFNLEVPFSNTGTLEVRGGGISISGPVTQLSGSTLTAGTWNILNGSSLYMSAGSNIISLDPDTTVRLSGATATFAKVNSLTTNNGTFQIDSGKNFTASEAFANTGTLKVGTGSTFLVNGAAYTQSQGTTVVDGMLAAISVDATGGLIQGTGIIDAPVNLTNVSLAPGDSSGILTVGALTMDSNSIVDVELRGLTPSADYDQLVVNGSATLNGVLNVDLINGFMPTAGNSFDILDWDSVSGAFATLDLPTLGGGLNWNTTQLYTAGVLSVIDGIHGDLDDNSAVDADDLDRLWHIIRGIEADDPGANDLEDLNGDGFANEDDVDFMLANLLTAGTNRVYGDANLSGGTPELADYNLWRTGTGGWANGDFDGSGGVPELNDYNLWRTGPTQFPGTVGSHGNGAAGGPLVPEPASLSLLMIGVVCLTAFRRSVCPVIKREAR